jgi:MFS family permease
MMSVQWRNRLGLPETRGIRPIVAALAVDCLGSGMFLPFGFIYFLKTTHISVSDIGIAISLAAIASLPLSLLGGTVVDRFGPRPMLLVSHGLRFAGFLGYVFCDTAWQIALFALLINIGEGCFWPANSTLVARIFDGDLTRWFGLERALRNAGIGVGGLLAGMAVSGFGTGGLRAVVCANAMSYAMAGFVIAVRVRPGTSLLPEGEPRATEGQPDHPPGSYVSVFKNRAFIGLVVATICIGITDFTLVVILPAQLLKMSAPSWLPGCFAAVNATLVATTQTVIAGAIEFRSRTRVLQAAAVIYIVVFLALGILVQHAGPVIWAAMGFAVVLFTFAELLQAPMGFALATAMSPEAERGRYLTVYQISWGLAGACGPMLFGWLLGKGQLWPWLGLVATLIVMGLIVETLHRALPLEHRQQFRQSELQEQSV